MITLLYFIQTLNCSYRKCEASLDYIRYFKKFFQIWSIKHDVCFQKLLQVVLQFVLSFLNIFLAHFVYTTFTTKQNHL